MWGAELLSCGLGASGAPVFADGAGPWLLCCKRCELDMVPLGSDFSSRLNEC
jgi:hypothetical protein